LPGNNLDGAAISASNRLLSSYLTPIPGSRGHRELAKNGDTPISAGKAWMTIIHFIHF
jgi:hypothetical protein